MNATKVRDSLPALAERIRDLHREAYSLARAAIDRAVEAGGLLADAKSKLPHGRFTPWVEENCGVGIGEAQRYMRLYAHRKELPPGAVGVKAALEAISEPKSVTRDAFPRPGGPGVPPDFWTLSAEQRAAVVAGGNTLARRSHGLQALTMALEQDMDAAEETGDLGVMLAVARCAGALEREAQATQLHAVSGICAIERNRVPKAVPELDLRALGSAWLEEH